MELWFVQCQYSNGTVVCVQCQYSNGTVVCVCVQCQCSNGTVGDGASAPDTPPPEQAPLDPSKEGGDHPEKPVKTKTNKKSSSFESKSQDSSDGGGLAISVQMDLISTALFVVSFAIRLWRLDHPKGIVFDELHYGKYAGHYLQNTFFFDSQPPFGKQLIALAAYAAGYDGNYKFERIGGAYNASVPVFAMRLVPAFFGALLSPTVCKLMQELGCVQPTALLAGVLVFLGACNYFLASRPTRENSLVFTVFFPFDLPVDAGFAKEFPH
ncbi:Glycosyl transferase family 39/83 [Trinorchestia longiramus]|nr:Glycosyl transferase family 39/83 [Trinorchestia longiramus]